MSMEKYSSPVIFDRNFIEALEEEKIARMFHRDNPNG
jgi:hypothetical protein